MLDIFGAVSLISAALMISSSLIREYKTRLHELEALYDMIAYIRDNIEHLMKPLPEIFQNYSNPYLENCGFLPAVRLKGLKQTWEEGQTFTLSGEACRLIDEFIRNIGSGYRTEELRLCEYTLGRLCKILDHTQTDTENQLKLYKTVPMMFALSIILILI